MLCGAHRKQVGFMTFTILENDLEGADWELGQFDPAAFAARPREAARDKPPVVPVEKMIEAHDSMARYVAWSPDGKTIASGSLLSKDHRDEVALWGRGHRQGKVASQDGARRLVVLTHVLSRRKDTGGRHGWNPSSCTKLPPEESSERSRGIAKRACSASPLHLMAKCWPAARARATTR